MKLKNILIRLTFTFLVTFLINIEGFAQTKPYIFRFEEERTSEKLNLLSVKMYFFTEGKIKRFECLTDRNGLVILDSLEADSLICEVQPQYEYCTYKYFSGLNIKLTKLSNQDTIHLKVVFYEAELKTNYQFYFQPFSVDCINEFNADSMKDKPCYCLYDPKCEFLYTAIEMLTCNQNLILTLEGNCTETEFKEHKDSLIFQRLTITKEIFKKNGIHESRIKFQSYGKSKPKITSDQYKETKSKSDLTTFETINTYVIAKIKRRT